MDVCYHQSLHDRNPGRRGKKLTPCPVQGTFLWGNQEIRIPAVYVGSAGAVLDVCAKIPVDDMKEFFRKWNRSRRMSLKTEEDFEKWEADNPAGRDFLAEMTLDGLPLTLRTSSSLNWYPPDIFEKAYPPEDTTREEHKNDPSAEILMTGYKLERDACWHLGRLCYEWKGSPVLSPKKVSLKFSSRTYSVPAGHFTTAIPFSGEREICLTHPLTGQPYRLTLHSCESVRHSFKTLGKEGVLYPEYAQILSYSIAPDPGRDRFDIRDCAEGDSPRISSSSSASLLPEEDDGPVSLIMTHGPSGRRSSYSSLHFEPVPEIRWRSVFQEEQKPPVRIEFPICAPANP